MHFNKPEVPILSLIFRTRWLFSYKFKLVISQLALSFRFSVKDFQARMLHQMHSTIVI